MKTIETLRESIIGHFNCRQFTEAEQLLAVLRKEFPHPRRDLAFALVDIAKLSKIPPLKKLPLLKEAYRLNNNKRIANSYASMLSKCKKFDQAFLIFEELLKDTPNDFIALTSYGNALANSGNHLKACEIFERSLKVKENDFIALNSYGKALAENGDYNTAIQIFEKSLTIDPNNTIALNSYGKALAENGDYNTAIQIFEKSLNIDPNNTIALNSYGKALAENGDYNKAIQIFEKSLNIDPNNTIALTSYGKALAENGDYNTAIQIFEKSLNIAPNDLIALTSYGKALADNGDYNKAIQIFEKSLNIDPNNTIALNSYGKALAENGDYNKAIQIFEKSLNIDPKNPILLASYGVVLAKNNLLEEARQKLEQSVTIDPNNILSLTNYGKILVQNKKLDLALEQFNKVIQLNPKDSVARFLYATTLQENGNFLEAIQAFKHVDLTKLPKGLDNFIYLNLGLLFYQTKQPEEGKKYFDLILKNYNNQDVGKLRIATNLLSAQPFSEEGIKLLQEIAETSPKYQQARQLLSLNMSTKDYFETFNSQQQISHTDTASLNRALYHKIQNEIAILKELVHEIISDLNIDNEIFDRILQNIINILDGIKQRRHQEESKIKDISQQDYAQLISMISQTAHDIVDFVGNKLAAIKEDIWDTLSDIENDETFQQHLTQLLQRIESTQVALNDLKAVNEGIRIKKQPFTVQSLFSTWLNTPKIRHAHIHIHLENPHDKINSDEQKIKSFLNELVENSLKHNPNQTDLLIQMKASMSNNPNSVSQKINTGKYLHIVFSDNGKGIPKDKKEWIFLPLTTTSKKGQGSGLGLFMIKRTLTELHGYINEIGEHGVQFDIYIPYGA